MAKISALWQGPAYWSLPRQLVITRVSQEFVAVDESGLPPSDDDDCDKIEKSKCWLLPPAIDLALAVGIAWKYS